ncbi:hypothetical protein F5884DRAFT_757708 [Xylogone sp. PMI_703]|nr:hypothetical protein F5884DRAFT_890476 [Xylogone sp. PMI_703]KAH8800870.1 hypothetical protein F5884DRAFT_757708 [Xylogone sp. PMI_703]
MTISSTKKPPRGWWALLLYSSLLIIIGSISLFALSTTIRFLQYSFGVIIIATLVLSSALIKFTTKDVFNIRVYKFLVWLIDGIFEYIQRVTLQKVRTQPIKTSNKK